ncbi:MAG: response regulator [Desulfobulbaceae bacterium]|nr:response regulator [Desulfobulbaceae bacterium]
MYTETVGTHTLTLADNELLESNEVIVVVDDLADITELLVLFLKEHGLAAIGANSAEELRQRLRTHSVALVILDIGLPDADGISLLPELKNSSPDTAIIMLTAAASLETALLCLRHGADDYLTKPVQFGNLLTILRRVLEKRRLALRSRIYQAQLENARKRIERAHNLTIKMNTAYLSITSLDMLMRAILTGLTAHEGLGFNRAFLTLFSEDGKALTGRYAIGPMNLEEGNAIWQDMQARHLTLDDLLENCRTSTAGDPGITRLVQSIRIDAAQKEHIVIRAVTQRRIIPVQNGQAEYPVPPDLIQLLQEDSFVIAPLYSSGRSLGAIIVDNFINRCPFDQEKLHALESFLSQASLAIEHGTLYQAMQSKVVELEKMTKELHKNKDMLVTAGRYSALGHMAAQLTHSIKNPLTAIGGTARLLGRKITDSSLQKFLDMMITEVEKVEKTLADLARFAETIQPVYETVSLAELARNAVRLYQQDLIRHEIITVYDFHQDTPQLELDPKLIQQVLVHLLANAIDAMPQGGTLTLQIAPTDGGVSLSILDTGGGISAPILENVTDPFFTTKTIGTGLGLSLVQRVLRDHGGELSLSNDTATGGAQARIWLPVHH